MPLLPIVVKWLLVVLSYELNKAKDRAHLVRGFVGCAASILMKLSNLLKQQPNPAVANEGLSLAAKTWQWIRYSRADW